MLVSNVTLVFLPSGAASSEAINAPNQQIYIDVTAGSMTRLQSNAQAKIVGVPPAASAVSLDDARDYHVVVSPTALPVPPTVAQGTTVRVSGGRLAIPPHIAIKLLQATGGAAASLACALKVGAATTNVTTTAAGWVMSNDKSAGEVMIRSDTRLLKSASATTPAVTLAIAPTAPVRGSSATITATVPAATAGFKVTEWKYDISHTNPGSATAATASVTRPATENTATFDQNWQGDLCASGTVRMKFVTGAVVRAAGDTSVSVTLNALDPVEVTLAVTVAARTGASWVTGLTEDAVGSLAGAINSFHDTGRHTWTPGAWATSAPQTPATGPNRGCQFLTSASASFTSTPQINTNLTNAASAFSLAQDKAYLTSPLPVRVIPRTLYTVGTGGAITETPPNSVATHFGITVSYSMSPHCIDQARLLSGTRRHESEDPTPPARSHKGNCLKALRALEPVKFAEALVKLPGGAALNFGPLMQARVNLVVSAAATHDIIDEAQTQTNHSLQFVTGQTILDVNADNTGALIGPAWNPTTNSQLT